MVRHPLEICGTKYCCFCCYFDPDVTCCLIAFLCITINTFSGLTNFGILHWALYLMSILTFTLHLVAGILLFLGGYWGRPGLKFAYCWLAFLGIFFAILGVTLFMVLHKEQFVIWGCKRHKFNDALGMLIVSLQGVWIIVFDLYTTMIVLGNIYCHEECCEAGPSMNYV